MILIEIPSMRTLHCHVLEGCETLLVSLISYMPLSLTPVPSKSSAYLSGLYRHGQRARSDVRETLLCIMDCIAKLFKIFAKYGNQVVQITDSRDWPVHVGRQCGENWTRVPCRRLSTYGSLPNPALIAASGHKRLCSSH